MTTFTGFTFPESTYLPPELGDIIPEIDTLAEIKITIALLDAYARAGLDAVLLTHQDLMAGTGLSADSVNRGLKRALARGTVRRHQVGKLFKYEPAAMTPESRVPCMHDIHDKHDTQNRLTTTMHGHDDSKIQNRLTIALVEEFGVSYRVATDLVHHHDPDYIQTHVDYARHAQATGLIRLNPPGWVVASIRDGWAPPKGYAGPPPGSNQRWYTDEEYEQYFIQPNTDPNPDPDDEHEPY